MDDLDMLARDFGFGPRGKSKPMRSAQSDRRPIDEPLFGDVSGGPTKYTPSSNSSNNNKHSSMDNFDYDSIFNSSAAGSEAKKSNSSGSKTSSVPVYDNPVYDEDIFDGLPGLKSKSTSSTVRFEDDVFASVSSRPSSKSRNHNNDFDDLFGDLGRNEKPGESNNSNSAKSSLNSKGFDDLLAGFGSGNSAASNRYWNRPVAESYGSSIPTGGSMHRKALDDPFVVPEPSSDQGSLSSGVYAEPLQEKISKLGKSGSARTEASAGGITFDGLDPLNGFGKLSTSFSSGRNKSGKDVSPSKSATPQSGTTREQKGNSSFRYSESNMEKKIPLDNFQEPPSYHVPNVSTVFQESFDQNASAPQYYESGPNADMSPTSGQEQQFDDIWLSVSEVPLFTQPTAAPAPSRPPPPLPSQASRSERGSFSSSSRKKADEFSSPTSYSQHSQSPKLARPATKDPPVSQFDELEDFAMGRSQNSIDERVNPNISEENNAFSAAAASAAAMKDAMDKAEAKFRHAKEVHAREHAKATRNKESVQMENDAQEREFRETEERLDRERKQKEEEERDQRRIEREKERSREIEREKARQAVERATREARERAAIEARERAAIEARERAAIEARERAAIEAREKAAAEARLKAERAAVDKANAEARGRAERLAVQRAQAEARERAAAQAKERAEKAAAEARERAAAAEASEKASAARAEAEARRRAERAAVERAAAEARQRAAAEARERASTATKINQQRNNDDLESFFNMGRASSAPRASSNSTDPLFDQQFQNKGGFEAAARTSSSSGAPSNVTKASSTTNIVDDLSSIFGAAPSSGGFQDVEGETEERRRARMDRHQRTQERAAKALAEKNQRDLQVLREQEERHRISETLDIEIKRWAAGREGNLRALLSTMQYVLWPECGWQPVSLTDLITGASVKKVYRKATLCIHPDKVQQKGANLQQKYIAEKVFDLLKDAWNKFNSEELF